MRLRFISLIVLLSHCLSTGCNPCPRWHAEHTCSCRSITDSTRLFLPPANPCEQLELEFVFSACDVRSYVNLLVGQVSGESTLVEFQIDDVPIVYTALVYAGGQRLLLPDEATPTLIGALLDEQCVILQVGNRKREILATRFADVYGCLDHNSLHGVRLNHPLSPFFN